MEMGTGWWTPILGLVNREGPKKPLKEEIKIGKNNRYRRELVMNLKISS